MGKIALIELTMKTWRSPYKNFATKNITPLLLQPHRNGADIVYES